MNKETYIKGISAEEFVRRSKAAGFSISDDEAASAAEWHRQALKAYDQVRSSIDYSSNELANVFSLVDTQQVLGGYPMPNMPMNDISASHSSGVAGASDDELAFASISDVAPAVRDGELSPVKLVNILLKRIELLGSSLGAFLEIFADEALKLAEVAEMEISEGGWKGPLHGVPVGLKDIVDMKGTATTCGSLEMRNNIPPSDASITARLKEAGAIIICKTNLVEFALGATGINGQTGTPSNPWNKERVTAGSSSGSAAAVAAGLLYGAIGSDTGGSIRMPAALCGIAGLKPTYGILPMEGVFPLSWSLDTAGPMTRSVADCAVMMNAMTGYYAEKDAKSRNSSKDFTDQLNKGLKGIRLGVPNEYFFTETDPEIKECVEMAIEKMARAGAEVKEVSMPWISIGRAINLGIMLPEAAVVHEERIATMPKGYSKDVKARIQSGSIISAADYLRAQRARVRFSQMVANAMSSVDALVTPTCLIQAPTIDECTPTPSANALKLPFFTGIFNTTGQPSLSVPCGLTKDRMPIGIMITGHAFKDEVILQIGSALEDLLERRNPPNMITL